MGKILIVEDDKMIGTMLSIKLKKENHEVYLAANGLEAKEMIGDVSPDLIVTDLMMPFVSGMELLEYIREELNLTIPVLVLSSAGQEMSVLKTFELGASDFVTKPFSPNELLIRIKKALAY